MLGSILFELQKIFFTYSKNPNRIYSVQNNIDKLNRIHHLKQLFDRQKLLSPDRDLEASFLRVYKGTLDYINAQLNNMASNFTIDIGLKLPVLSTSRDLEIRDFLNTISATHDLLNDAGKAAMISYVVKAKIQSHCKTKIESMQITTYEELKNALYTRIRATETSCSLQNKLVRTTINSKLGLSAFASRLESLASQMAELEITAQTPADAALSNAVKASIKSCVMRFALNQFRSNVPDHIKTLLDASNPSTLSAALALASTASVHSPKETVAHMQHESKNKKKGYEKKYNKDHKKGQNKHKKIPRTVAQIDEESETDDVEKN